MGTKMNDWKGKIIIIKLICAKRSLNIPPWWAISQNENEPCFQPYLELFIWFLRSIIAKTRSQN
jgi:hypothetical protein